MHSFCELVRLKLKLFKHLLKYFDLHLILFMFYFIIYLFRLFLRLKEKGISLTVSDDFKERLVEEGYNPSYGARPLRRAVMRLLEDSLAEEVLSGRIKDGDKAEVDIDESKKVIVKHLGKDGSKPELASAAV